MLTTLLVDAAALCGRRLDEDLEKDDTTIGAAVVARRISLECFLATTFSTDGSSRTARGAGSRGRLVAGESGGNEYEYESRSTDALVEV